MLARRLRAAAAWLWLAPAAHAAQTLPFPDFDVAPCCELCPTAANPAAYNTSFLHSFRVLLQGEHGWLFRSRDDLRTQFGPDARGLRALAHLDAALARRGVELVMVVQPPRGLMHRNQLRPHDRAAYDYEMAQSSYARLLQQLRSAGIVVPDLERVVREGGGDDFFFRTDHHWTPHGARRVAEVVAETIRALPQYAALPRTSFVTREAGLFGKRGTMDRAARQLCGYGAREQYVRQFVTEPAGESAGADLLGDTATPPVTLAGTSNSDPAYNFAGFLSQALELDILNVAQAGGGFAGSLLTYVAGQEFRENPPAILVWEVEPYHNFSDEQFYRQALPLVDNGCNARPEMLSDEQPLGAGRNEVLFNGGGRVRDLRSGDSVVDLKVVGAPVEKLSVAVWYSNGRRDTITLEDDYPDRSGRYVFTLRDEGEWADFTFLGLDATAEPPPAGRARIEARLCARAAPASAARHTGAMP